LGEVDKIMGTREWGGWGWVNETGRKIGGRKKGNHEWHEGGRTGNVELRCTAEVGWPQRRGITEILGVGVY
jgi:hypothetical protein